MPPVLPARIALALATAALPTRSVHAQAGGGHPVARCTDELRWAAAFAARNYAGYADKVTAATRPAYAALLDTLNRSAGAAGDDAACDALLRRWVAFFRDRHLGATRAAAPSPTTAPTPAAASLDTSPAALRARFAASPRVPLDEAAARARLDALGPRRARVEGIFESPGGRYRVAVLRNSPAAGPPAGGNPGATGLTFAMVVLRADSAWWTPGQVKAYLTPDSAGPADAYRARFFMRDHAEQAYALRAAGPGLLVNTERWLRHWPVLSPRDAAEAAEEARPQFAARNLAPGAVLVRFPNFGDTRAVDSLWAAEGVRIRAADRLVIDVRGNGGGSDYNYRQLRPLLYTGPVYLVNAWSLATDDNLRAWRAFLGDPGLSDAQRRDVAAHVARLARERAAARAAGRGDWVASPDDTVRGLPVLTRPRRVAVLADGGCGSSCEEFLLEARQSRKVTLYGAPSAGVLDYANVLTAEAGTGSTAAPAVPGSRLVLHYPTTRSKRLPGEPIDNVGVPPAVRVPDGEAFAPTWVLRHLDGAAGRANA